MGHNHTHDHDHGVENIRAAFLINLFFSCVELVGGIYTNSVAILSDALHDFGDSISLGISRYLQKKSTQPKDAVYTYGYKRFSLLGAFITAIILTIGSLFVIKESLERITAPESVDAKGMVLLAVFGIVCNSIALFRLKKGTSLNEKIVSLHFLEDVLGRVTVLVGALVMMFYNVPLLDSLLSLAIACFILYNIYRNLKPAIRIMLQGIPDPELEQHIRKNLATNKQVVSIHDFHLWSLDGEHNVVTMHVVVINEMSLHDAELLKEEIKQELKKFHIECATIEIEYKPKHCIGC